MNKLKAFFGLSALLAGSAFASQASALVVDFTDSQLWGNPAPASTNYYANEVDATYPGPFEVSVTASPLGSQVAWEQEDGFGVFGAGDGVQWDDDLENGLATGQGNTLSEILTVTFSEASTVGLIRIADFTGSGEYNTGSGWTYFGFGAGANGPGNWYAIDTTASSSIMFRAIDGGSFQVSGLNLTLGSANPIAPAAVPLPPAVWLLGSALVFLVRKRKTS